jgi:hypothetical protein
MKLIFIGFVFISSQTFSQTTDSNFISKKAVNKTVKEISKIIKKESIFSDSLNWREINQEIHQNSLNIKSKQDLRVIDSFFIQKLRGVGDKHSFFLTKHEIDKIQIQPQENKQAESKYLENGVAYINVPSCLTLDDEKDKDFANNIRTQG